MGGEEYTVYYEHGGWTESGERCSHGHKLETTKLIGILSVKKNGRCINLVNKKGLKIVGKLQQYTASACLQCESAKYAPPAPAELNLDFLGEFV